jgi:hypothetical protein
VRDDQVAIPALGVMSGLIHIERTDPAFAKGDLFWRLFADDGLAVRRSPRIRQRIVGTQVRNRRLRARARQWQNLEAMRILLDAGF